MDHIYAQVKSHVQLDWAVCEIIPTETEDRPAVDVVVMDRAGGARGYHADWVIFAAPQFLTQFIIRDYRDHAPTHLAEFEYAPWLVANLFLHDRPQGRGFPLAWDNVLYESQSLGYVVATHQRCADFGPTVLTYYYPFTEGRTRALREEFLNMEWEDCAGTGARRSRRCASRNRPPGRSARRHALGARDGPPVSRLSLGLRAANRRACLPEHPFCQHGPKRPGAARRVVRSRPARPTKSCRNIHARSSVELVCRVRPLRTAEPAPFQFG